MLSFSIETRTYDIRATLMLMLKLCGTAKSEQSYQIILWPGTESGTGSRKGLKFNFKSAVEVEREAIER